MTATTTTTATALVDGESAWDVDAAIETFGRIDQYWLATSGREDPRLRPVVGVVADGFAHFVAGAGSAKARDLARDPACAFGGSADDVDLSLEGSAEIIRDPQALAAVAAAYVADYEWGVDIRDGAFWADGTATAGPPPFDVYRVVPARLFAFPTGGHPDATATRFVWTVADDDAADA